MNYHDNTEYISKSGLDLIHRSPLHYWERYLNPERIEVPPTPALLFGGLFHCLALEPDKFQERYAVAPQCDKRTKEGKELYAQFEAGLSGQILITGEQYQTALDMAASVLNHSVASQLLEHGEPEQEYYLNDFNGSKVKIKPDWINDQRACIIDLKSTEDASFEAFKWSCKRYRYAVQAAFYSDVLASIANEQFKFILVAVEKTPPYAVGLFAFSPAQIIAAREEYEQDLRIYKTCLADGAWQGYEQDIQLIV